MAVLYRTAVLACLSAPVAAAHAGEAPRYDEEPVLEAATLVPPERLGGPGFTVDPHVEIRGYMAHFTLDTPAGPLQAQSVEILAEREDELPVLLALERLTRSDAFTRSAGGTLGGTARAVGNVMLHPIQTLRGLPAGVARFFAAPFVKLGRQAQSLSDRVAREWGTAGNPYPAADGPMTDARQARGERPGRSWYAGVGAEAGRELKRQAEYGQAKRELARQLGVDPYTSNPYLHDQLDRLAWAGVGGRLSAAAVLGGVGGTAAMATTLQIDSAVWSLDGDALRARNEERFGRWCADDLLVRQFLRRGTFTPTFHGRLLESLDTLRPAAGGDALLELAMSARSELEARFVVNALRLLAADPSVDSGAGRLRTIGAALAWQRADGSVLLPLPVDYLSWTPEVEAFFDRAEFRLRDKTALVAGQATPRVRRGLTERGWGLELFARWPGAPRRASDSEPAPLD
ncbi:MAG TPA: hypothetical protein VMR06_09510 [Dokdonella sp.]|nr:hypothetical protein [Dokdonella sp.]